MALFTNPLGNASSTYLGPMSWAALQASAYANGSVGLAALNADSSVFITDWRVAMVPSASKTYWECPHAITIAKAGLTSLNSVTGCNAAITWTLAADPSNGKTRITSSGAHGITSAVNGKCINITAWSGTGVAGLYTITYVDATNIDLTIAYSAGYGNPTVSPIATEVNILTVSPPAKLMQASSQLRVTTEWRLTSSTNSHFCILRVGATAYMFITPSNVTGHHDLRLISNINSVSSQQGAKTDSSLYGGSTSVSSAIDTSASFDLNFRGRADTVAEFVELMHYTVEAFV